MQLSSIFDDNGPDLFQSGSEQKEQSAVDIPNLLSVNQLLESVSAFCSALLILTDHASPFIIFDKKSFTSSCNREMNFFSSRVHVASLRFVLMRKSNLTRWPF